MSLYADRPDLRPATPADLVPGGILFVHDGHPRAPWQLWRVLDTEPPREDPDRPGSWLFTAALGITGRGSIPCRVPLARIAAAWLKLRAS